MDAILSYRGNKPTKT